MSHIVSRTKINKKYKQNALANMCIPTFQSSLGNISFHSILFKFLFFLLSKYSIQFSWQQKQFLFLYSYSIGLYNRPLNLVITKLLSGEQTRLTLLNMNSKSRIRSGWGTRQESTSQEHSERTAVRGQCVFFRGNSRHRLFIPAPSETMESLCSTCLSISICI